MSGRVDKAWFEAQLRRKKLSARGLARLMDMDASAMSLMLNGRRRMSVVEAGDVARLLGVSVDEVLRHIGVQTEGEGARRVPVVGTIMDRGVVRFGKVVGPNTVVGPSELPQGTQALRRQGGVLNGWLIFYVPCDGVSLEAVGRLCVVEDQDGGMWLKFVNRGYEPGYHSLTEWGGEEGDAQHVQVVSAAPVLWLKQ